MERLSPATLDVGRAWPLGAQCSARGVNFAVFSAHAHAIELCLFDAAGENELARMPLPGRSGDVWHGHLRGAAAGLVYGLRAHGPWQPELGHRFDASKLLVDPCAREIVGRFDWQRSATAANALKSRVVAEPPPRDDVPRPRRPLGDCVIYEAHVKGLTMRHPDVPQALRGTYAGLATDAVIAHLQRLGVTTLSLLPVHQHLDEQRLAERGLTNYWGYNTIGYFAVEPRYASGVGGLTPRDEFRAMVTRLHDAGVEVILDVVFNHTAETDTNGPTLCWRGLDNLSYYRTLPGQPGVYDNLSGCGNALDLRHPRVLQMVMDCLRYWVQVMGVDGFRFDLAPVLGRGAQGFDPDAAFFHAIAQDPVLAGCRLIAEPWDLGPGGYQLGRFPRGWLEWNDRFRDGVRSFWLGGAASRGEFAQRLCASSDLFHARGRAPAESVNFVAAHDGFSLRDLLTYERKCNLANGEGNRDGHDVNHGWNCGAEGESDDAQVLALRSRLQRALLATLLIAQGTPMIAAGDELGRSQRGNNNAYCQDNEGIWIAWATADQRLIEFAARLVELRHRLQPLAEGWYAGTPDERGLRDLAWRSADGTALDADAWSDPSTRTLVAVIGTPGRATGPLLLAVNAEAQTRQFALPAGLWRLLLDTTRDEATFSWQGTSHYPLDAHGLALLELSDKATG